MVDAKFVRKNGGNPGHAEASTYKPAAAAVVIPQPVTIPEPSKEISEPKVPTDKDFKTVFESLGNALADWGSMLEVLARWLRRMMPCHLEPGLPWVGSRVISGFPGPSRLQALQA